MRRFSILSTALLLLSPGTTAAQVPADDVAAARRALKAARAEVRAAMTMAAAERAERMILLGLWSDAEQLISAERSPDADVLVARARLHAKRHRYDRAAEDIQRALRSRPRHRAARLMRGHLEVQRWDLPAAAATAQELLRENARDEAAALLLGRVRLLEKQYDDALRIAREVQQWNGRNAAAHALEADVRFWNQDPAGAEPPLVRALELDPFDADARFNYGYAIWRRVDATQLNAMAAQWDLALTIDSLHYTTHWHWGNGHTNLTYADYAHPSDSVVRLRLLPADSLISRGRITDAVRVAREVESAFPASVLPAMMRGSAYYLDAAVRPGPSLDSAEAAFRNILGRKPHYGPAHNGLAAVIKKRQFLFLEGIDSLEAAITAVPLPTDSQFLDVFADAGYYPGDRVRGMIRQQLGPTEAYVPFLHRLGQRFTIPPLHKDLAEAMNRPSFRSTTTFDNRQWMDIRGVGGGSTGIEYVERGSHWERNVLLHEYAHLFHGNVLTDAENRRIRELYHAAMQAGRTLDYYAANNESEFFAQAWEAYVMPKKVHPLNHKAMNTVADLRQKDPELAAFVDSMATRLRAALAGDRRALRSNWAETYVNLARRAAAGRTDSAQLSRASTLLDSALVWDDRYLPAMVFYASVLGRAGRFAEAPAWLDRAAAVDARYAPVYAGRAALLEARARAGAVSAEEALNQRVALLERALQHEADLAERAGLNTQLRELLADHGRLTEAIRVAEDYGRNGPTISTYLRDRRDEARAFALELRAASGYAAEAAEGLARLVEQKPFNYTHRAQYADALAAAGRHRQAIDVLEQAQRVLRAAGSPRADYALRIAELYLALGRRDSAAVAAEPVLAAARRPAADTRLARVLVGLGNPQEASLVIDSLQADGTPRDRAELAFTRGRVAQVAGDGPAAEREYRAALEAFAYHVPARVALIELLRAAQREAEAHELAEQAISLPLPLGPDFQRQLEAAAATRR